MALSRFNFDRRTYAKFGVFAVSGLLIAALGYFVFLAEVARCGIDTWQTYFGAVVNYALDVLPLIGLIVLLVGLPLRWYFKTKGVFRFLLLIWVMLIIIGLIVLGLMLYTNSRLVQRDHGSFSNTETVCCGSMECGGAGY